MRWNRSLIPTLRDDPADAEAISHKLMVRAGLVRQLAAGIYVYAPMALRTIAKYAGCREISARSSGERVAQRPGATEHDVLVAKVLGCTPVSMRPLC